MRKIFRVLKFFQYQWKAKTKYYLHSPFVYQFYLNVIEGKADGKIDLIRNLRKQLRTNYEKIQVTDYGTDISRVRKVVDLEKQVAVSEKYGELLYRLVRYFQPETILELGTSIGLSSAYMAVANERGRVLTIDGSQHLVAFAQKNHSALNIKNVETVADNFETALPVILEQLQTCHFVFFDGNHTEQATLTYFGQCIPYANEESVFVFDDIHWSSEMNNAWNTIKQHPSITLTIDVYQFGICFFRKEKLAKENFVLRY